MFKGRKRDATYGAGGAQGDTPDVEAAALTTKEGGVTPVVENDAGTKQNPWTSPTAVILFLTFALVGYVCWIYSDMSAPEHAAPASSTASASPAKAVVTGDILADIASGATNLPFNNPRVVDFDVHDSADPADPYFKHHGPAAPAAPVDAVNGHDASGTNVPPPGEPGYVEAQHDPEMPFEAGMGEEQDKLPEDFVLAALGAARERAY